MKHKSRAKPDPFANQDNSHRGSPQGYRGMVEPDAGRVSQALVQDKQVVVPVTAKELARREAAGEAFQVIPAKLFFTLKAFTARRKAR